jgi:hypothetical protein
MIDRRKTVRTLVDLTVRKLMDGHTYFCRACEISSKGIRLKSIFASSANKSPVDIEVPLVEGKLITAVAAQPIWQRNGFEAFEFVGASYAQRTILEKLFGGVAS